MNNIENCAAPIFWPQDVGKWGVRSEEWGVTERWSVYRRGGACSSRNPSATSRLTAKHINFSVGYGIYDVPHVWLRSYQNETSTVGRGLAPAATFPPNATYREAHQFLRRVRHLWRAARLVTMPFKCEANTCFRRDDRCFCYRKHKIGNKRFNHADDRWSSLRWRFPSLTDAVRYPTPYRGTSQAPYPTKRTYPQRTSILSNALQRYVINAVSCNKCRCLTTKQKRCINIYNFWQLVAIAAKKNKKKNMNMKTNKKTRRTVLFILISVHLNGFYL